MIPELLAIPHPEAEIPLDPLFVPCRDTAAWIDDHFLNAESPLLITDHQELVGARLAILWTNVPLSRSGQMVAGTAQLGKPSPQKGDAWARGAIEQQRREWFGWVPDLLVILYAPWFARTNAVAVAAILDHELRHFGVKTKEGEPVYDEETGRPVFRMVGHDLEEFRGTVEHFGVEWDFGRKAMRDSMNERAYLDLAEVERIVGPPLIKDPWQA